MSKQPGTQGTYDTILLCSITDTINSSAMAQIRQRHSTSKIMLPTYNVTLHIIKVGQKTAYCMLTMKHITTTR